MASLAVLLGAMESSAKGEALEVIELMGKLSNISLPPFVLDKDTLYNPTTLKELSGGEGLPQSWTDYVQKLLNFGDKKIDIEDTERVIIEDTNYYNMLSSVLQNTKKKTLANYAGWKIVVASLRHIESKELSDIFLIEFGQKEEMWQICSETVGFNTNTRIPMFKHVVNRMYATTMFNADKRKKADEMTQYLRDATSKMLEEVDWMDDETKDEAKKKLKNMKHFIGYPDEVLNKEKIDDFYKGLNMVEEDYFGNVLKIHKHNSKRSDLRFRDIIDHGDWQDFFVAIYQAAYTPFGNYFRIPAGILQGGVDKSI